MNRRHFLSNSMTLGFGFFGLSKIDNIMSLSTESNFSYDIPPLIFNVDSDPATILHKTDKTFNYVKDKTISENTDIVITCNKFGHPNKIYSHKKIKNTNQLVDLEIPETSNNFIYTIYNIKDGKLSYIGESTPMYNKNSVEKNLDILLSPNNYRKYSRNIKNGYYDIQYKDILEDESFKIPISTQYFTMNKRLIQYGNAQTYIKNNKFLESIGKKILSQVNTKNKADEFNILRRFVQEMNWIRDIESKNKLEYIRDPRRTIVNYHGDCKDTTILMNGLLENVLNIETVMLFAPTHVYSGVKKKDLSKTVLDKSIVDNPISYELNGDEYYTLESTDRHKIGLEPVESDMYMYYNNSYNLFNVKGLTKHLSQLPNHIIEGYKK